MKLQISGCCEGTALASFGIDTSGCLTQPILERALGESLLIPKRKKSQRPECNCLLGSDIGAYKTCAHGCIYCYANFNQELVRRNLALRDPCSPFLIGNAREGDILKEAKQESYLDSQLSLF